MLFYVACYLFTMGLDGGTSNIISSPLELRYRERANLILQGTDKSQQTSGMDYTGLGLRTRSRDIVFLGYLLYPLRATNGATTNINVWPWRRRL